MVCCVLRCVCVCVVVCCVCVCVCVCLCVVCCVHVVSNVCCVISVPVPACAPRATLHTSCEGRFDKQGSTSRPTATQQHATAPGVRLLPAERTASSADVTTCPTAADVAEGRGVAWRAVRGVRGVAWRGVAWRGVAWW